MNLDFGTACGRKTLVECIEDETRIGLCDENREFGKGRADFDDVDVLQRYALHQSVENAGNLNMMIGEAGGYRGDIFVPV